MAVVTISRELAALGDETAHELAHVLKYRLIDKRFLEDRMRSLGVTDRKIEKYDERKPSFFASLSQDRDDYLHYLRTAIFSEAGQGDCVFIGRGAEAILRGIPGVFSVFLSASPDVRRERVKSYFHCDDKRALQIIEQSDRDREGFHQYFFESAWKNPENYHLTLNTGRLHPALCAEIIRSVLEKTISADAETGNALMLKDLILGQQVVQHVVYEKNIPVHFLEARSVSGDLTLYGVANSQALIEAALAAAKEVPAVRSVSSEIQVVQEYSVVP